MKKFIFYATREDLVPVTDAVERSMSLIYARMGQSRAPEPECYTQASTIPNLGRATTHSVSTNEEYLVVSACDRIQTRTIRANDGSEYYLTDQLVNPTSISFAPGGLWDSGVLLHGRIATVSDTPEAKQLLGTFEKEFRKRFRKVKAFWVGEDALNRLRGGTRLTISAQSPREFDLQED